MALVMAVLAGCALGGVSNGKAVEQAGLIAAAIASTLENPEVISAGEFNPGDYNRWRDMTTWDAGGSSFEKRLAGNLGIDDYSELTSTYRLDAKGFDGKVYAWINGKVIFVLLGGTVRGDGVMMMPAAEEGYVPDPWDRIMAYDELYVKKTFDGRILETAGTEDDGLDEDNVANPDMTGESLTEEKQSGGNGILSSADDIDLRDTDGRATEYLFTYGGTDYRAVYTTENWRIYDSYRIESDSDMLMICQALIDEHPIHGSDMVSFRTAEDMVYEWQIHNMAYSVLDDGDELKDHAKDVDFDPADQNRSLEEIYRDRTGKDLDMNELLQRSHG